MEWWNRLGGMYQFFNDTPALAKDMTVHGPEGDFAFYLAYGLQNTSAPIDVYPADSQSLGG